MKKLFVSFSYTENSYSDIIIPKFSSYVVSGFTKIENENDINDIKQVIKSKLNISGSLSIINIIPLPIETY